MTPYRHNDWKLLIGAFVEIRKNQQFFRSGVVDEAMPDSSALWLAADGGHTRVLIEAAEGYDVWVEPRILEGKLSYRMTTSALQT